MPPDQVIGVDVGGTKILAGAVARDGSIGRTVEVPTPTSGQEALLAELDAVLGGLLADGALAIGVGVPMNLDRRTGYGFGAVNLPLQKLDLATRRRSASASRSGSRTTATRWRSRSGASARAAAPPT